LDIDLSLEVVGRKGNSQAILPMNTVASAGVVYCFGLTGFRIVSGRFLAILPGLVLPCEPLNSLPLKERLSPFPIVDSPQNKFYRLLSAHAGHY
jgi:hypothetical protein